MAEPKESHAKVPKAPESRLKRAAKQFGKYAGAAALATAITLSPFSLGFTKGKPSLKPSVAQSEEEKIIPASDVFSALEGTKKLIQEGKVQEIKFDLERKDGFIKVKEWGIAYGYVDGIGFVGTVGNKNCTSKKEVGFSRTPIVLKSLTNLAASENTVELAYVKAYIIQRPDDSTQTMLVVACKDHLDFYVLNDKKEIEWVSIPLDKVGITKKPSVILSYGQNQIGQYVRAIVFDETVSKQETHEKTARFLIAFMYPKPEGSSRSDGSGAGTILAKMDLQR